MKTIVEKIKSFPGLESVSTQFIEDILVDRSLNGADNYSPSLAVKVNLAAADIYTFAVNYPDFSENKLSETLPRSEYKKTAIRLYMNNGEPEKARQMSVVVPRGKANSSW